MVSRCLAQSLLILLSMLCGLPAHTAEFRASIDRGSSALNEPVVLTLSLTDSETRLRAEGISPNIDLTILSNDFDVGTPRVENRYNVNLGRGRSTSELQVELFPRRAGNLTIPAFRLEGLQTKPLRLIVRDLAPSAIPEVFSRGGVSKPAVWQREQFVAWLDVYHRIKLKSASVGEYINTEPMRIELMEHRELPQSEREEMVQGARYQVTRIAWAIYPKESGELRIVLPDVWLVAADDRKLRLPHQPEQVTVRALPASITDDIPVGTPQLSQTAPLPSPATNQLSTWTVTVSGPFSRFALPDRLPLPPAPARVKLYTDRAARSSDVTEDGVIITVNYNLSALPEQGGRYSLPSVHVPYFDTARGEMAMAELLGTVLDVPGESTASTPAVRGTAELTSTPEAAASTVATPSDDVGIWQWSSVVFALLWLATLFLWRRANQPRTRPTESAAIEPTSQPSHPLQAQLLAALGGRSLELGLREWEAQHGVDQDVRTAVRGVQNLLYGPHKSADAALTTQVAKAVDKIRGTAGPNLSSRNDPWRPEAFSREIPPT